jgi:hypothetical protein
MEWGEAFCQIAILRIRKARSSAEIPVWKLLFFSAYASG